MTIIPAIFVIDKLDTNKINIATDVYNHNVAINYRTLCKKKLSSKELVNLFVTNFLLNNYNFKYLTESQKISFLTNIK